MEPCLRAYFVWFSALTEISGQQLASPTEDIAAFAADAALSLHIWPEEEMRY